MSKYKYKGRSNASLFLERELTQLLTKKYITNEKKEILQKAQNVVRTKK